MATYAIGDIHGHFKNLLQLLDHIHFDRTRDRLWFVGDLVNRGPQALEVLRFVRELGSRATLVLGNHELCLLALSVDVGTRYRGTDAGLETILEAPDAPALCAWLRKQPFLHVDATLGYVMVHAGLPPQWDLEQAKRCADELTRCMQSDSYVSFLTYFEQAIRQEEGQPRIAWSETLRGDARLSFICNAFTRMRFCDAKGGLDFQHTGPVGSQPSYLTPWFTHPNRKSQNLNIIHGHWAALRGTHGQQLPRIYSIDGGCAWGGDLIALCLETCERFKIRV